MSEESHVYHDNGELAGLYTIDGAEARKVFGNKKFWEGVDECIRLHTQLHPVEMKYATVENSIIRDTNNNEFASNDSSSMRQALNIPHGLYLVLIDYEIRLFRDKKMRTAFMRRYPMLRTCNKV